jgi:hypothetical protein
MSSQKAQIFWSSIVALTVALLGLRGVFAQKPAGADYVESVARTPAADLVGGGEFH